LQQQSGTRLIKSLLKKIKSKIEDEATVKQYRHRSTDFVRNRGLPFCSLVYFLLQKNKSSLQQELDDYFADNSKTYTKSALSQQRLKLKHEIFEDLNEEQLDFYYSNKFEIKKWKGLRLLALDGSTLQLPHSNDVIENFGIFESRTENNRKILLGRISQVYDVLNSLTINAKIDHYKTSELALAQGHLPWIQNTDLVLMDRGYAAFWFMALMQSQGKKFLIRLKENKWKIARDFLATGKAGQSVVIKPSKEAVYRCKEKNIPIHDLSLRIVRVKIPGANDYVLITNLTDEETYNNKELAELYRLRWPVEESFKLLKIRAELENLSGKSTLAIKQDFYRIIFRANLSQIYSLAMTSNSLKDLNNFRKNKYQINKTQAFRKSQKIIKMLYQSKVKKWIKLLYQIGYMLIKQVEIIRTNMSNPVYRRYSGRPANFMAYKP